MRPDLRARFPAFLAVVLLASIALQTRQALRSPQGPPERPRAVPADLDRYRRLEAALSASDTGLPARPSRDPFTFTPLPADNRRARVTRVETRPATRPVLTAIVLDEDPRAVLRHQGQSYTVRAGGLFAEFRVLAIAPDQVVLEGPDGERIALKLPGKGD